MTVGNKYQTMLANLKSVQADLESFSLESQNQNAKQLFRSCATETGGIIRRLEQRWNEVSKEEPSYTQQ
ncbi:MAG: DUF1657 domain-containing protein [Firmicutes bacterium]|nr:DUF1657 domain-containing protein [Bacillota bacterium]